MSLFIQDNKKKTVRHYCTTPQVEKAIETILAQIEDLSSSETHEGYKVDIRPIERSEAEWLKELQKYRRNWEELKETLTEVYDNSDDETLKDFSNFLINYMNVLEKKGGGMSIETNND